METAITFASRQPAAEPVASIGIIAWNEESTLGAMLESLFRQSLFQYLAARKQSCEIWCLVNGSTDRTAHIARTWFELQAMTHPHRDSMSLRVVEIKQRGKVNAWNRFVHEFSARPARLLFLADADIVLRRGDTLWNMMQALEKDGYAHVAVDRPCKHFPGGSRRSALSRLSLAAGQLTASAEAQLCGQLYCIRSELARCIYLPKDLAACDDGFIKALVCTDFMTGPSRSGRICIAAEAEHSFEAYTSAAALLRNQKRQIIGQTIVHILIDQFLSSRPSWERQRAARTMQELDLMDPGWLKRLIRDHLRRTRWSWRLYPGLATMRWRRLVRQPCKRWVGCLPAAVAGSILAVAASVAARRALRAGCTDYWPRAPRQPSPRAAHASAALLH